jgi:hypothetical protein
MLHEATCCLCHHDDTLFQTQALMDEGKLDLAAEGMAALDKLIAKETQWDLLR